MMIFILSQERNAIFDPTIYLPDIVIRINKDLNRQILYTINGAVFVVKFRIIIILCNILIDIVPLPQEA